MEAGDGGYVCECSFWRSPLAGGAAGALAGAAGAGGGAWAGAGAWLLLDARRTSMRQVGQVCCLWNQERRQLQGGEADNATLFEDECSTKGSCGQTCCTVHTDCPLFKYRNCVKLQYCGCWPHLIFRLFYLLAVWNCLAESHFVQQDLPGVENVITWQFLGSSDHFLATDNTDIVRGLQVLRSSIRVSGHGEKWGEINSSSSHRTYWPRFYLGFGYFSCNLAQKISIVNEH